MNPYVYSRSKKGRKTAPKLSAGVLFKSIIGASISPVMAFAFVLFAAGSLASITTLAYSEMTQPVAMSLPPVLARNSKVQVLGDSTSAAYPYASASLVNDSGTVYFIRGATKIPFTSSAVFTGLGYSFSNVINGNLSNYSNSQNYTINSVNIPHPWGGWVNYQGTVYYSGQQGLIGVPSSEIFSSNGGEAQYIVKANKYDIAILQDNPNLPVLTDNDSRVYYASSLQQANTPVNLSPVAVPVNSSIQPTTTSATAPSTVANSAPTTSLPTSLKPSSTASATAATGSAAVNVKPVLTASISSINLTTVKAGNNNFENFNLTSNYSGASSSYSIGVNPNNSWLSVSPSSGTISPKGYQSILATANTTSLTPGTYGGSIVISYNFSSGVNDTITIPVTINIAATTAANNLYLSQSAFNFSYTPGGTLPAAIFATVTNTSKNNSLTYSQIIGSQPSWFESNGYNTNPLLLGPGQSAGLGIWVDPTKVSGPGTYTTSIVLRGNFANSPITIPITLIVNSTNFVSTSQPILVVSPNGGESYTTGQVVNIQWSTTGITTANNSIGLNVYDAATRSKIVLSQTVANTVVNGKVSQSGSYNWTIPSTVPSGNYLVYASTAKGWDESNAPFSITATATATPTTYTASQQSLSFNLSAGQQDSAYQSVIISSNNPNVTGITVTTTGSWVGYEEGGGLTEGGISQSLPVTLEPFAKNPYNMAAGTYPGSIVVTQDGIPMLTIPLTLTVGAAATTTTLTVTKNSGFSNQTVSPNQTTAYIGSYVIQAGNIDGVKVSSLYLGLSGSISPSDLANLYIVTPQGRSTPVLPTANNTFPVNFTIAPNQSANVDVYADIGNATGTLQTSLSGAASDAVTNQAITAPSATGQNITVAGSSAGGSMNTPTLQESSPVSSFVIGGSTNQPAATFNFTASGGGATIQELDFNPETTISTPTGDPITSVTVDGVTVPVVGYVADVTGLNISVPSNFSGINVPITVNYAPVGQIGLNLTGYSNATYVLTLNRVRYLSGVTTSYLSTNVYSNVFDLVGSAPTVALVGTTNTMTLGNELVGKVTISANAAGNIVLNHLPITASISGGTISSTSAVTVIDDATSQTVTLSGTSAGSVNKFSGTTGGSIYLNFNSDNTIAAGSSKTYDILIPVAGITGSGANSASLSLSLGSPSSLTFNDINSGATNVAGAVGANTFIANYPTGTVSIHN